MKNIKEVFNKKNLKKVAIVAGVTILAVGASVLTFSKLKPKEVEGIEEPIEQFENIENLEEVIESQDEA